MIYLRSFKDTHQRDNLNVANLFYESTMYVYFE